MVWCPSLLLETALRQHCLYAAIACYQYRSILINTVDLGHAVQGKSSTSDGVALFLSPGLGFPIWRDTQGRSANWQKSGVAAPNEKPQVAVKYDMRFGMVRQSETDVAQLASL